ncbi:MAG: hypothetical protein FWD47_15465 [Treponema sp.]|nr:hypothetical protein [Treponema sp.]
MSEFNSKHWFPYFRKLAAEYNECADKKFVSFRDLSIDEIEAAYFVRSTAIKEEMFENVAVNRIDRHKVLALYIQLHLEKPLFWLHNLGMKPRPSSTTLMYNELFCLDILQIVLEKWTGKHLDFTKFGDYKFALMKLFKYYREHSEFHKYNLFFTFNFAHLIYFIERDFMA